MVRSRIRLDRADFARWLSVVAFVGASSVVMPVAHGGEGQSYYRYRDADGVLHITNVPRGGAKWKLWRSFPGSGGDGARQAPRGSPGLWVRRESELSVTTASCERPVAGMSYRWLSSVPVIHTESNFHPSAVSSAGAMGLMQLMPSTAKFLGVGRPFEPRQNIMGGSKFLRLLANRFDGDMVLVLAGYHAGAGAVQKYGGVPPYESTRAYVKAVLRRYYAYTRAASVGGRSGSVQRRAPARYVAQ